MSGAEAKVRVDLGDRGYDILIGEGVLDRAGELVKPLAKRPRLFVVADQTVAALHLPRLAKGLEAAGLSFIAVSVPPGEHSKSFAQLDQVLSDLIAAGAE